MNNLAKVIMRTSKVPNTQQKSQVTRHGANEDTACSLVHLVQKKKKKNFKQDKNH